MDIYHSVPRYRWTVTWGYLDHDVVYFVHDVGYLDHDVGYFVHDVGYLDHGVVYMWTMT